MKDRGDFALQRIPLPRPWSSIHSRYSRSWELVLTRRLSTCRELDWVVIGDATCQDLWRTRTFLLRDDRFAQAHRPDLVIRFGRLAGVQVLMERIRQWRSPVIALDGCGTWRTPMAS